MLNGKLEQAEHLSQEFKTSSFAEVFFLNRITIYIFISSAFLDPELQN